MTNCTIYNPIEDICMEKLDPRVAIITSLSGLILGTLWSKRRAILNFFRRRDS